MRNFLVLLLSGLTLGSPGARAEDFTGFYAGVNAGYAFGRNRDRTIGSVVAPGNDVAGNERSLPPSAESASQAMQARSRTSKTSR